MTNKRPFKFRHRVSVPGIAKELLRCFADPKRHTQRRMARDSNGYGVDVDDPAAVCWCVDGAAAAALGVSPYDDTTGRLERFETAFNNAANDTYFVVNDNDGLAAVRRVLRKLARSKHTKHAVT